MQRQKLVITKKAKIMSKETEDKGEVEWALEIGLYPGILFGLRTYPEKEFNQHILYLPFINICLTIFK
jgi:hypothetical protein